MKSFAIMIFATLPFFIGCEESATTQSGVPRSSFDHYIGKFDSMNACIKGVKKEAKKANMELSYSSDRPEKVTGSFNGDPSLFFVCEEKSTGTEGTYYEIMVPVFK